MAAYSKERRQIAELRRAVERRIAKVSPADRQVENPYAKYRADPSGYCRDVLRVCLTPAQEEVCRLIVAPPYRVLCSSGHNVGKSFLAACLVNWWFDVYDPGICLTTAPTQRQVNSILWAEVRMLRRHAPEDFAGFTGPKAARLESAPNHWAEGFTAKDGNSFQGHHSPAVFVVFDEAEGVDAIFWEAAETMLQGEHFAFLAIYNPTTSSSQAAQEERKPGNRRVVMSCLDHPNIAAELAGLPAPYPSSARLGWLQSKLEKWATRIGDHEEQPGDVRLGGKLYRPSPMAEARLLGRRPATAINAIWSDALFDRVCLRVLPEGGLLQLGCDVARFGDDNTAIHVRRGGISLHHESANGWDTVKIAQRLKALAHQFGTCYRVDPKHVLIAVDDCGVGGGVTDVLRSEEWAVVGVNAAARAVEETEYPNMRSALWFGLRDEALRGNVSLGRLDKQTQEALRRELTAPTYTLDVRGRRVVEAKDATKERLGGESTDNADALHLSYANLGPIHDRVAGRISVP